MLVPGQGVTDQTFNDAFISKTDNSSALGKITFANLENATDVFKGAVWIRGGATIDKDLVVQGKVTTAGVFSSSNMSGTNTGDVSFANVGTTPSPKGATIAAQTITLQPADGTNPGLVSVLAQSFAGVKTYLDKVFFQGGIEVQGEMTVLKTQELQIKDASILINKGGTNTSAESAGLEVERETGGNGALVFDSALVSKWKIGIIGALYEIVISGATQTIAGLKTFSSLLTTVDLLVGGKLLKGVETNTVSGTNATLTNPTKPVVELTNASLVSISTINAPPSNSQTFVLINKTGVDINFVNGTGISTGTGANLILGNGKTLQWVYDIASTKWRVVGGSGSGGSAGTRAGRKFLDLGDQTVTVTFSTPLPSADYTVAGCFTCEDASPIWLMFQPTDLNPSGFTARFNAPTDSGSYSFLWTATEHV